MSKKCPKCGAARIDPHPQQKRGTIRFDCAASIGPKGEFSGSATCLMHQLAAMTERVADLEAFLQRIVDGELELDCVIAEVARCVLGREAAEAAPGAVPKGAARTNK